MLTCHFARAATSILALVSVSDQYNRVLRSVKYVIQVCTDFVVLFTVRMN